MNGDSSSKLDQLRNKIREMQRVVVAYSGGLDSTFLVKVIYDVLGDNAIAVTATSSTYPKRELVDAKKFAKDIGIEHIIIQSEETEIDNFAKNPENRCYYCKKELFLKIKQIANERNIPYILDGSNVDDIDDFRPGMKALSEMSIRSPLKEIGFSKEEIKKLSYELQLSSWDKPAFACLASRFPYGTKITKSKLNQIEQAESYLHSLDINQFRVRYHNEIARIEVSKDDFPIIISNSTDIVSIFKKLGFTYIALDIEGYRTGSLNEVIDQ